MMRRPGFRQRLAVGVLLLSILGSCSAAPVSPSGTGASPAAPSLTATAPPLTPSPSGAPEGVNPEKFEAAVKAYISEQNDKNTYAGNLELVELNVTGIIGFVDISLIDTAAWSGFTDVEKKEYMTALGKALDTLAIGNAYPGTLRRVGTDTTLYAPKGAKLAERTSLGIVKLFD